MRKSAIRLLAVVVTTMLAGAVTGTPVEAAAHHSRHLKTHATMHLNRGYREYHPSDRAWPAAGRPSVAGEVCPGGIKRSFECGRWPPPIDEDPDRIISGSSGD